MSQSNVPDWLAWVVPVIAAGGVIWSFARRLFVSVTREELAEHLEKDATSRELRRQEMHQENLDKFDEIFDRLGRVEKDVSYIRGRQSKQ